MLQLALLLLGGVLTTYLWDISRTVAFTLFGAAVHVLFTLAGALYHNCPYHTLPSILIRDLTRYLTPNDFSFAHSVRSLVAFLAAKLCRVPHAGVDIELAPPAVEPSTWNPGKIPGSLEALKGDVRCISWMLFYTLRSRTSSRPAFLRTISSGACRVGE